MAMAITAKVRCNTKVESGVGDNRSVRLSFIPDYADGRNKEWAFFTPSLMLEMTVRGGVADRFETSKPYTLTFSDAE